MSDFQLYFLLGFAVGFLIAIKLERMLTHERRRRDREQKDTAGVADKPVAGLVAHAGQEHAADDPYQAKIIRGNHA